jgi:DNA ligase-1
MTTFDTLYKLDSKCNIREWRMESDGDKYRTIAGLQDGQQVTSAWTTVESKNVGRSNETSPEEQVSSEIRSHYQKKLDVDYFENVEDINTPKIFKPMLADNKSWAINKVKVKFEKGVYFQYKLDGIRCITTRHGMFSRTGKPISSSPHIMLALQPLFELYPDTVLDGELYNHDLRDDFEEIVSLVKREESKPGDFEKTLNMVQYHVYDYPTMMHDNFGDRHNGLISVLTDNMIIGSNSCIKLVPALYCTSEAEVDAAYDIGMDFGYEGGIIRIDAPYQQKRTKLLLKRKDFEDAEFTIVRIEEGVGNWKGCAKRLIFQNDQGECGETGAGMRGKRDVLREVFYNRDSYIGTEATIKFFGRTKNQKPRIPVVKYLHKGERTL